jgi:hypothetical protein
MKHFPHLAQRNMDYTIAVEVYEAAVAKPVDVNATTPCAMV